MILTEEQKQILSTKTDMVIEARAGTGKTTTLIEFSLQEEKDKKLYLAFNKSISEEAKVKFADRKVKNISISTAHGLAYKSIIIGKQYKLGYNLSTYHLAKHLKTTGTQAANKIVTHSIRKFDIFCNSAVDSVDDIVYKDYIDLERSSKFYSEHRSSVDKYAKQIWDDMVSKKLDCTHSFYLKLYQLSKPVLNQDIIMLDEAQDANPVILDIFFNQKCRKVMVGDNHQAIYSWRGAINALKLAPENWSKLQLTESFRFPQEIADLGLEVLSFKEGKEESFDFSKLRLIGKGTSTKIETKAIISRSNIALLEKMIVSKNLYRKPFVEGGLDSLLQTNSGVSLTDIFYLKRGEKDKIQNFFVKNFKTLDELLDYYEDVDDQSINSFCNFIKKFENSLLVELDALKKRLSDSKEYADYIFSTIHKAKGNEWDEVTILSPDNFEDGFPIKVPNAITQKGRDGKVINIELTDEEKEIKRKQWIEELNIYYVAVTRAKVKLSHSIEWLGESVDNTNLQSEDISDDDNKIVSIKWITKDGKELSASNEDEFFEHLKMTYPERFK